MKNIHGAAALAALALGAFSANAQTLFSTGFEAAEGYTNGTQLSANANWTGDGQDASGWQVTNTTVGGSGAKTGTQWVLASSPTASVPTRYQWTVTPVTDFSVNSTIVAGVDTKLVSPSSGSTNRSTLAGIQMYDAAVELIGALYLIHDTQNAAGGGAGEMLLEFDSGDGTTFNVYDLGVANATNQYVNLSLAANFQTGVLTAFFNGSALPDLGNTGGRTDFHDFDIVDGRITTTSGGTADRAGFDNYSVVQTVPAPASLALLGLAGGATLRRRRR
jgi:hypothetical protein